MGMIPIFFKLEHDSGFHLEVSIQCSLENTIHLRVRRAKHYKLFNLLTVRQIAVLKKEASDVLRLTIDFSYVTLLARNGVSSRARKLL